VNPEEDALQAGTITPEQQRAACVTLASLSLAAAGGDEEAARGMLREVLEVIGAVPYPRAHSGKYHFGEVRAS
jgi:hypothetical protein